MDQKKNEFSFQLGENRVYAQDLKTMLGLGDLGFPHVSTVAYLLKLNGYQLSEIYSDGFCVILNDQKEVENVQNCIYTFINVIGLPRTDVEKKARAFHKKMGGLYLTAMEKVCTESWQFMFPDLRSDAIRYGTANANPNHSFHFFANIENNK